jgi:PEP-CTERM motif
MRVLRSGLLSVGSAAVLFGLGLGTAQASEILLRFNDYDGGSYVNPSYGFTSSAGPSVVEGVQGFSGLGVGANQFSGNMLRNAGTGNPQGAVTASWTGLPLGGTISFSLLFAAIDSWDGLGTGGPDYFEVLLDGIVIFSTSIDNFPAPPATSTNGGSVLASGTNLGFSGFFDSAWDFTNVAGLKNIAYSGTTANFEFRARGAGWQGGTDESWGWDNVRVTLNVPEPGTLALLGLGFAGLAATRRRKK